MKTVQKSPAAPSGSGIHDPTSASGYVEGVSEEFPDEDARARAGRRRAGTLTVAAQIKKHPLPGDGSDTSNR